MTKLCDLLGVSRSGYYAWRERPISEHRQYDMQLMKLIKELHQGYRRAYGAARLHREMRGRGYGCSRRRINRLMRVIGVKASTVGLYAWRPGQHEFYSSTGNQLGELDAPTEAGEQWVSNIWGQMKNSR